MFFRGDTTLLLLLTWLVIRLLPSSLYSRLRKGWREGPGEHAGRAGMDTPSAAAAAAVEKPYLFPPLKLGSATKFGMGLRMLDRANWLTIDGHYLPEHNIRSALLSHSAAAVLQCRPGSEEACQEVLETVSSFLTSRYPSTFTCAGQMPERTVHNLTTGERYPLDHNPRALETAARLAMEDFNLLVRDPGSGEYRLQASATLFPAGWKLEERIGYTMTELHRPVPGWKEQFGHAVTQFFDGLSVRKGYERHTLFVQTSPELFQDDALCSPSNLSCPYLRQMMKTQEPRSTPVDMIDSGYSTDAESNAQEERSLAFPLPRPRHLFPSDIHVRRERQTFTRLPVSNAILFTVRTYIRPLTALGDDELAAFMKQAGAWEEEMAAYKGRERWWPTVRDHQAERDRRRAHAAAQ